MACVYVTSHNLKKKLEEGMVRIWLILRGQDGCVHARTLKPRNRTNEGKGTANISFQVLKTLFMILRCRVGRYGLDRRGDAYACGWGNILTRCALPNMVSWELIVGRKVACPFFTAHISWREGRTTPSYTM